MRVKSPLVSILPHKSKRMPKYSGVVGIMSKLPSGVIGGAISGGASKLPFNVVKYKKNSFLVDLSGEILNTAKKVATNRSNYGNI